MLETSLVLVALLVLGLSGLLGAMFTARLLTALGLGAMVLGLLLGIPTGFWYHVILYRLASAKTSLPGTWWLAPARLHVHLSGDEQSRIRPWYRVGGVGFVLSVAGGAAAIVGLLMER